jgi:hypothetical protein
MRHLMATVAAALVLSACGTIQVGRDFDLASFNGRVQRGVTTQAEVRSWLGAPESTGLSVETSGERYEQWNYFHGSGALQEPGAGKLKLLQIKFDAQGVVRGYNWSGQVP